MISKILLCSLAFSSIVRLIDRTGLPTWLNENGPPAVYTLTRVHFQYFKYTEFYFFLRILRYRLKSRFLGCITAGRSATSSSAKVPLDHAIFDNSFKKEKIYFYIYIIYFYNSTTNCLSYCLLSDDQQSFTKDPPSFDPYINPLCPQINTHIFHTGLH